MNKNRITLKDFITLMCYFKVVRLTHVCSIGNCKNSAIGFLDTGDKRFYICERCIQLIDTPFHFVEL